MDKNWTEKNGKGWGLLIPVLPWGAVWKEKGLCLDIPLIEPHCPFPLEHEVHPPTSQCWGQLFGVVVFLITILKVGDTCFIPIHCSEEGLIKYLIK